MAKTGRSRTKRKFPTFGAGRTAVTLGVIAALGLTAYAAYPYVVGKRGPSGKPNAPALTASTEISPPAKAVAAPVKSEAPASTTQRSRPKSADADGTPSETKAVASTGKKLSPEAWQDLDNVLAAQIKRCWTYPDTDNATLYAPKLKIAFSREGSISGTPVLVNPGKDPAAKALAESATKAMIRCRSLTVPARFKDYYAEWKVRVIHFGPSA